MKQIHLFLFLFIISLFVYNCGGEDSSTEETTFKRTQNEVIVRLEVEPDRLNPIITTMSESFEVLERINHYLLSPNPVTFVMEPELVTQRPVISEIESGPYKGGVQFDFEIHEEAVWDNGSPVTGNDYVFALKTALHPSIPADIFQAYITYIKDVIVDPENPKKFRVLTYPKYINIEPAITNSVVPIPAYFYDEEGLLADYPLSDFTDPDKIAKLVEGETKLQAFAEQFLSPKHSKEVSGISGCGPYRITSWESGQEIVLEKKENWWGDQLANQYPALEAYPDRLIYKIIPNSATALAGLKAEEIDAMTNIQPQDFVEMQESELVNDLYNLYTIPDLACYFILTNTRSPKLNDKRVRQALSHAMPIQQLLDQLYLGFGQRVNAPLPPNAPTYNKDLPIIEYDIEKAKALLDEAGWTDTNGNGIVDKMINGELVEMNLNYFHSPNREISINSALVIQEMAKPAGFNITPVAQEYGVSISKAREGDFELLAAGQGVSYMNWEPGQRWHSRSIGGTNYPAFSNEEADEIINKVQVTFDEAERNRLYHRLQEIIYDEQPIIFMFEPTNRIAIHKRFDGDLTSIRPGYLVHKFELNL